MQEQVKSEHQNQGISSGAKKLLEFLQKKPTWFDAVMKGMDIPSLKLKETKVLMLKHKGNWACVAGTALFFLTCV